MISDMKMQELDLSVEQCIPISSLQNVAAAADELILCSDVSTVFRRAVELSRTKLGIERGAIFIEDGEYLKGTYGTNCSSQTTCEDALRFPKIAWFGPLQQLQAEDARWTMFQDTHWEWDGDKATPIGEGWIVLTPIRIAHKLIGIFVNDAAINKSCINSITQEVVAIFCSLLGNIIERKQAEDALKTANHELERRVQERVIELTNTNAILEAEIYQKKQTEKVLAYERNLLRTLIDNLPDYIFAKDTYGRFMISNIAHAQAAGISNPDDFIGKTAYDFFPEEFATQYEVDDQAVLQGGHSFVGIERVTLDASGEPIWVSTTKLPLQDENGQIIGIVGISRDITAYKRTREALQKQEAFLRQIIDTNPNLIFVKDDQGKFTLVNKAHAAMFGTTTEKLIGKTDSDFGASQKQVAYYLDDDREVMRTLHVKLIPEEIVTDVRTGTDSWFQTIKVPLVGADGKAQHVLGVSTDITARKQAEEALAKERNLLRILIDYLPDAIYIKDAQGRMITCNQHQTELILKASELSSFGEVVGKTDLELFPDNGAQYFADEQMILRTGVPLINKEEPIIRLDGSSGWHLTSKIPFHNTENQVIGLVGIGIDITDRKKAAEALAQERNLLRTVIDALPDLIYAKHSDSRLLLVNDAFLRDRGMTSDAELIGKTDFELHPLELAQQYYGDDQTVMQSGCPVLNKEEQYIPLYGEAGWLLTTKVPLRDLHGNIIGLVGIGRDVTERKRIEAALQQAHSKLEERVSQRTVELSRANEMLKQQITERQQAEARLWQSQQMLQSVMDNIPLAIFWKDRNSTFLGCNRQFAHDMDIQDPGSVVGKTDYEMPCTKEQATASMRWIST
jgi:PAS domain S-box-containing protein